MTKMKRVFSVMLVCVMLWNVSTITFAHDISPYYQVSCPVADKHNMQGAGTGKVYEGSAQNPGKVVLDNAYVNQCSHCYLVVISQLSPQQTGYLGWYTIINLNYALQNYVVAYGGLIDSFYGNLIQDSFWGGFNFR